MRSKFGNGHRKGLTEIMRGIFLFVTTVSVFLGIGESASRRDSVAAGPVVLVDSSVKEVERIEKDGIEWQFDGPYKTGTFANGDPWVLGPVVIIGITPVFDGEENGWEINPEVEGPQGFAADIDNYDISLVPMVPCTLAGTKSVVKTVRSAKPREGNKCRECLLTASVLTVVSEIPSGKGSRVFRPPYVGKAKPYYQVNDLRMDLLPSLEPVGPAPNPAWVEETFGRLQLDHKEGRVGRNLHPIKNIPDYGADIGKRNGDAALALLLSDPPERKLPGVIAYVQYGIDLYHMAQNGHRWGPGGGHRPGQKLPVIFAAVLLHNRKMKEDIENFDFFHEDQLLYKGNGDVLYGSSKGYGRNRLEERYWETVFSHVRKGSATGYKSYRDPYGYIDGGFEPGNGYQFCCTSQPWKGEALTAVLVPEIKEVWNNEDFFAYVDRWVEMGTIAQPDPCAPPGKHWKDYGVTFGPDGSGGCIQDRDSSDGVGRFPERHGATPDGGERYSRFQDAMWREYRYGKTAHNTDTTN